MRHAPVPRRRTTGSVLMLMPAAVLIVLLLGAIAVDSAVVYLAQRQAYNVAFDAANDAAGAGFDRDLARRTGEIRYDPDRVRAVAEEAVAAAGVEALELIAVDAAGDEVAVTVEIRVRHVFAPAFGRRAEPVRMTARAAGESVGP